MRLLTRKKGRVDRARAAGFTLVEALIALTVLLITAVSFVPLISQGFSEVFLAGYRIQAIHEAQGPVDSHLVSGSGGSGSSLTIAFPGADTYTVDGEEFKNEVQFQQRSTSVTIFIPE